MPALRDFLVIHDTKVDPFRVKEFTRYLEVYRPDPIAEAEAALQKLRKNPNDKQAMQALANAAKTMNENTTSKSVPKPPAK